jgi:hypothetical protein
MESLLDWEDVSGVNVDQYNVYRSTAPEDVGAGRTQGELEPHRIATTPDSEHTDPAMPGSGECFFYSVRTLGKDGSISE